jgi:NitT/TauT family transport system ATP-binding protein
MGTGAPDVVLNRAVQSPGDREPTTESVVVRSVQKRYSDKRRGVVEALGPIDLTVKRGEFVCLVGPSGCGKSTLLRIVAGLLRPSEGEIEVNVAADAKAPFSMVFQDYGIYPWKTVEANVRFGLQLAGYSRSDTTEIAGEWLARLRLSDFASAYPDQLSGGMRQRVAIARALATDPEILLMDEPFAALDAQLREVLQAELLSMWEARQRTVLFVTHSLEEALVLGDRVVVMSARPGRIVESVDVPVPRPRTSGARSEQAISELRGRLWELLRAQVDTMDIVDTRDMRER